MIGKEMKKKLNQSLLDLRQAILNDQEKLDNSWKRLISPEIEIEEYASKRTMARKIESLDEISQKKLDMIEDALSKMEQNIYGICEDCGKPISVKRLLAVPWARQCIDCADLQEHHAGPRDSSMQPSRYKSMSDKKIEEFIMEDINADDRINTDKISVSSSDGIIYLGGVLPDTESHEIVLETIEDVFGIDDIVDNIRIEPI